MRPRPVWSADMQIALERVWNSGIYSNSGPSVVSLERELGERFGTDPRRVVMITNATIGLEGAAQILGARRWVLPSWTFSATANALVKGGRECKFVDVEPETWMISKSQLVGGQLGKVLVLPFGAGIGSFHWQDDVPVVIDAAASVGAKFPPLRELPASSAIIFSLHATKVVGVGEGGFVVFGSDENAERFRGWINFGFSENRQSSHIGTNGKMQEVTAALLQIQFQHFDEIAAGWREARSMYLDGWPSHFAVPFQPDSFDFSPYFVVQLESRATRNFVEGILRDRGIESRRWWSSGCHTMKAFDQIEKGRLEETNQIASRYLGLPFFPGLKQREIDLVRSTLAEACVTLSGRT